MGGKSAFLIIRCLLIIFEEIMSVFWQKKKKFGAKILAHEKSEYNEIYVTQNGAEREMWFRKKKDFFLQSRININELDTLILIYSKIMVAALLLQPVPRRILMLGLGGCAVSNFLSSLYPRAVIDVVEVDRKVIDIAKNFFYLNETSNYRVHHKDGRRFVQDASSREPYDLIYLDAFKSGSIPFHLKTVQFYQDLVRILSPEGVVGSNLYGKSNTLKHSDWKTFSVQFKRVYCFEDYNNVATVLFATDRKETLTMSDFAQAAKKFHSPLPFSLTEIAATYRAGKFENDNGDVFEDDFPREQLGRTIEKNNLDDAQYHPYPIKNKS